jgi:hypothetical protein
MDAQSVQMNALRLLLPPSLMIASVRILGNTEDIRRIYGRIPGIETEILRT